MSFLKLEPAARHLRELAKTHAAGGMPRHDYRRARREIIEELHIDFAEHRPGARLPIDGFSTVDEVTGKQSEGSATRSGSSDSSASSRTSRRFWQTVLCVFLLVAILFAGQSINAVGL